MHIRVIDFENKQIVFTNKHSARASLNKNFILLSKEIIRTLYEPAQQGEAYKDSL